MISKIEQACIDKGLKMTGQRRLIARVLSSANDHPDVEEVYRRAVQLDSHISLATVYRTVRLLEEAGILERHEFRDGRARYEAADVAHHDHLIDIDTGEVFEFNDDEIEKIQSRIAGEFGYRLVDHRLALYGVRIKSGAKRGE
jgi:Fur family ferric uptake transcriptional regulator